MDERRGAKDKNKKRKDPRKKDGTMRKAGEIQSHRASGNVSLGMKSEGGNNKEEEMRRRKDEIRQGEEERNWNI